MFGAIEAGGTKFVCGVGHCDAIREHVTIPTRDVAATMDDVTAYFEAASQRHGKIEAFGVGCFGPLELDPTSPAFGRITTTPKPGWRNADLPAWLQGAFGVPVAIDTDVNAAALAAARIHGDPRLAYVTVGTGVGVGIAMGGGCGTGFGHPEAGHLLVRRHPEHGSFAGVCPFHGDCLEGLASGPAIIAAWGASLAELPDDHPAWSIQASYLGQLCASLVLTLAPGRIVLGGGVMQQRRLLPLVRAATLSALGAYCERWDESAAEARIVAPPPGSPLGLVGAFMLAAQLDAARSVAVPS